MNVDTPALTIAPLRADDPAAVEAEYEISRAARAADVPEFPPLCRHKHKARLRHPWPGGEAVFALAYLDAVPVGRVEVGLPLLDNLKNANVEVVMHPAYRLRGVGRALFEYAISVARRAGRSRVMGMTLDPLPGGPARDEAGKSFAVAMGMTPALADVRRRLDLSTVDPAEHDRLLAGAWTKAGGYSTVHWGTTTPEEMIEDVASLDSLFLEQAPLGDLAWEPEKVDAERLRRIDDTRIIYGVRTYNTGVRHDTSGRIVAWSALAVLKTVRWHAWQQITLVHPEHRGHRLGMISKIANLRYLLAEEPEVRVIDTWNAKVNSHMIAINDAMGFRAVDAWTNWQLTI